MPDYDLIAILGPTASGKTPLPLPWPMNSTQKLSVPIPVRYIEEWISVQERFGRLYRKRTYNPLSSD